MKIKRPRGGSGGRAGEMKVPDPFIPTHASYHAKLMSVIETLRLEGGQLLPKLQAVLQQGMAAQLSTQ